MKDGGVAFEKSANVGIDSGFSRLTGGWCSRSRDGMGRAGCDIWFFHSARPIGLRGCRKLEILF